mmetsp:Transcript_43188/g.137348  ORF Transcript_43188/g.137348 Transcript_43188/m.137348 type:complete len:278 (-) Transcript_43188:66-899(-)
MAAVMGQAVGRRSLRGSSKRSAPVESPEGADRHRAALKRRLEELDELLQELSRDEAEEPAEAVAEPPADPAKPRTPVSVIVGTSGLAAERPEIVKHLTQMVNRAYGYQRVDKHDIKDRLAMGDRGHGANRVLHIAFSGETPVGCMSSTFSVPWAEDGCGHWGLLVVDVERQGEGIASALVASAEERLASACVEIQMEYEFTHGEDYSERLKAWYEGKCGFRCVTGGSRGYGTEFRKCRKRIPAEQQRRARRQRVASIRAELAEQLASLEAAVTVEPL